MEFSDWVTFVSILAAAVLAVFKFDEWEIIQLKKVQRFVWLPCLLLLLSGASAYYSNRPHFAMFDPLWIEGGLEPNVWSLIWLFIFFVVVGLAWNSFVNQAPTRALVEKYCDYVKILDSSKFSSFFRKYERFFFNNIEDKRWLRYQSIFILPEWWSVGPIYFKEVISKHPMRFYQMSPEVLKTLLRVQFSTNNTALIKELDHVPNEEAISEKTPLLNIFLGTKESIEEGRKRNILLPTIKDCSERYFFSPPFIVDDQPIMLLKPIDDLELIPHNLMVFYYINFTNWYWVSAIRTRAGVAGFYQYRFWTEYILEQAPIIVEDNLTKGGMPNHYLLAVDKILANIHDWQYLISSNEITDLRWATDHFIQLKITTLKVIRDKFTNKIIKSWFIMQTTQLLFELIACRTMYGENFNPDLKESPLPRDDFKVAFDDLTNQEYVTDEEQARPSYIWLKEKISFY